MQRQKWQRGRRRRQRASCCDGVSMNKLTKFSSVENGTKSWDPLSMKSYRGIDSTDISGYLQDVDNYA